jgi:hypothetical protein
MKTIQKIIAAAFILLIATTSIAQTVYQANVKVTRQEQNEWCWDANCKCIMDYYGTSVKQCEIAEYVRTLNPSTFGSTACCTSPSGKCNNPNNIEGNDGMQGVLMHFANISSVPSNAPIALTKIKSELAAGRPFVIGVLWSGGGGHVVLACNYSGSSITFMDPWQNNGMTTKTYTSGSSFSTSSGSGNWGATLVLTTPHTTTGIADQTDLNGEISIYPNPSSGEFNIHADYNLKTINVFNTTGQLVERYSTIANKSFALKIPAAGLYTLQVVTDNGAIYKKVVVE